MEAALMPTPLTSGTANFTLNATGIVTAAFSLIGYLAAEQPLQAFAIQDGLNWLNILLKAWQKDNIHLWTQREGVIFLNYAQDVYALGPFGDNATVLESFRQTTLSANAAQGATVLQVYSTIGFVVGDQIGIQITNSLRQWTTIATVNSLTQVTITAPLVAMAIAGNTVFDYTQQIDRPLKVTSSRRNSFPFYNNSNNSTNEIPMEMWSRQQYFDQVNKGQPGTPVNWYYSPLQGENAYSAPTGDGLFYIWQAPSSVNDFLRITYTRSIQDVDDGNNNLDFPTEWNLAIIYSLALLLGIPYSAPIEKIQMIAPLAKDFLEDCKGWDQEITSLNVQPMFRGRS
jgi:hypothetical protein